MSRFHLSPCVSSGPLNRCLPDKAGFTPHQRKGHVDVVCFYEDLLVFCYVLPFFTTGVSGAGGGGADFSTMLSRTTSFVGSTCPGGGPMGAAPTTGGLLGSPCGSSPVLGEVQPITQTTIAPDTIADTTRLAVFIRPLKSRADLDSSLNDDDINAPICVQAWPPWGSRSKRTGHNDPSGDDRHRGGPRRSSSTYTGDENH
jgi:hypothetical protein